MLFTYSIAALVIVISAVGAGLLIYILCRLEKR